MRQGKSTRGGAKRKAGRAAKKKTARKTGKKAGKKTGKKAGKKAEKKAGKKKAGKKKAGKNAARKSGRGRTGSGGGTGGLEVTDVEVIPVGQKINDQEEMLAQFVVTFNRMLSVRGFALVRTSSGDQENLDAFISPPIGVDADGESYELIRFKDADDPDESPMWQQVFDAVAGAFAKAYDLEQG